MPGKDDAQTLDRSIQTKITSNTPTCTRFVCGTIGIVLNFGITSDDGNQHAVSVSADHLVLLHLRASSSPRGRNSEPGWDREQFMTRTNSCGESQTL